MSVDPHGGVLVDRFLDAAEAEEVRRTAATLPSLTLDARELADLELIAVGAASPLTGFLGSPDYRSVLDHLRLADGTVWPLPFNLAVDEATSAVLGPGTEAALYDPSGRLWGVIGVEDVYARDPLAESRAVYGTEDRSHPGVAYLLGRPRRLVGGSVRVLPLPADLPFGAYRLTPRALRAEIAVRGWRRVAGFQTRNPIHRAHEHLTKVALEVTDGLVLHPLVGETKGDDVPAAARFRAYEALVSGYYPPERTILAAFPAAMRYAGPREALFHALARKNYGITHLLVGRDHAGVGRFYGPFDAHAIFESFTAAELGVTPIKLDTAFFCRACASLASTRTCPHDPALRLELSGTRVREILRSGGELPREFTRVEVAEVLREHYAQTADIAPASAPVAAAAAPAPAVTAPAPTPAALFPVFLKLSGRRVLVVGGGPVAASKVKALLDTGALLTVVAPEIGEELHRPGITLLRRPFRPSDLDGAWLVVAAAPAEVNRQVRAAAEEKGVFVNAVDHPDTCSAYAGGVLTRGGVTVAVSSNGEAPALAGLLREALEAVLPDDLGAWLAEARTQRKHWREKGVPMPRRRPLLLEALNRLYTEVPQ
ncbi:MAG TPA: sulfate adenylyltransferase [Vicinamibacteria bacterium]|nr:sulfate adenylyltransferase [Vicinamibacteria bacterium]